MEQLGNLIVISGPSGTGKGTICRELLRHNENLAYSISATTRAPRAGETDGVNYWFTDKEAFEGMIARGELLEWAQVYGNYYGTPLQKVNEMIARGKDVLLEIDPQGALKVQEKFPNGVFIYILPPSLRELSNRIYSRGTDSAENIKRRLSAATEEIRYAVHYNYVVVNDVVETAEKKIMAIIAAEKCATARNRNLIEQMIQNGGNAS